VPEITCWFKHYLEKRLSDQILNNMLLELGNLRNAGGKVIGYHDVVGIMEVLPKKSELYGMFPLLRDYAQLL
jgi:hypothetical protein